jgi:prophage antirepressor-like protein
MQYELKIFEYLDHNPFRVVDIDGNPWFVLGDVCRHLDLKEKNGSFSHHADRLDDDERRTVPASVLRDATSSSGREVGRRIAPTTIVINESGLYSLILRSDKPQAKKFRKWVTSEVLPSIRRTGMYGGAVPAFIRRFNHNWDRVEPGYFSVLSELVVRLWGRLEQLGYIMKDQAANGMELRPDVSVGRRFSGWLKENHPLVAARHKEYLHWTPAGDFPARQYQNDVWPLFIEYVDTVWLPECGPQYFKTRDPGALQYLPRLLPPPKKRAS